MSDVFTEKPGYKGRLAIFDNQPSLTGSFNSMGIFLGACIAIFGILGLLIKLVLNKKVGRPV